MSALAIVTGASRGIGLKLAERLLSEGWNVINLSRHPCPLPAVTNLHIDLNQLDSLTPHLNTLLTLANQANKISLIHNAGLCPSDSIQSLALDTFEKTLRVNVTAPAWLSNILLPSLKPGSSIIYIGSTLSEMAVSNTLSYVTSKHAIIGLMKATMQDLFGTGIHTCCVCPGLTDTDMLRERAEHDPKNMAALASISSFNRLVDPTEVVELIWFCINNPVINGSVLHANLGQKNR